MNLDEHQKALHAEILKNLQQISSDMVTKLEMIGDILQDEMAEFESLASDFESQIDLANDLISEIELTYNEFTDDKSDRWLEGKKAEKLQTWIDELCSELDYPISLEIDLPDPSAVQDELESIISDWKDRPLKP